MTTTTTTKAPPTTQISQTRTRKTIHENKAYVFKLTNWFLFSFFLSSVLILFEVSKFKISLFFPPPLCPSMNWLLGIVCHDAWWCYWRPLLGWDRSASVSVLDEIPERKTHLMCGPWRGRAGANACPTVADQDDHTERAGCSSLRLWVFIDSPCTHD